MTPLILPKRLIKRPNLAVSVIGLGTTKFGRNQGVKYPQPFELPSDDHLRSLLRDAKTLGMNLIDTAPAYGSSEERIGKLLDNRYEWIIATKVGENFNGSESLFDFSYQAVLNSLYNSLSRLRTDFIDIVNIHSDGRDVDILQGDAWQALVKAKQKGLVRAIGMSVKTLEGVNLLINLPEADVMMVEYNLGLPKDKQQILKQMIITAESLGIGVLVKKAFSSGHLNIDGSSSSGDVERHLHFCLDIPVSSVVVGTIKSLHLQENAQKALTYFI